MKERKICINTSEAREKKKTKNKPNTNQKQTKNNKENRNSLPDGKENPGKQLVTHSRLQWSLPSLKGLTTKAAYDPKSE